MSYQSHISYWAENNTWPEEYFTCSAPRSDPRSREESIVSYRNSAYLFVLETLGDSYMRESHLGITDASKALHELLLKRECATPEDTLFRDDIFNTACENVQGQNEARIVQDFTRLLAPSPMALAAFGATHLDILVESVNEGWDNSVPITGLRPKPDFAVGFKRSVFSDIQLSKLQPMLGGLESLSYFRATHCMFFPFLTCEVCSGLTGLDIPDRQNAHSMTLAVRGIVELFKLGKRENELHRELLTFSISHDHQSVRLYGYYPVFDGPKTKIHRHKIHAFYFTAQDGKEKWTTYKFTVAVYHHSLTLLQKIRSLVDDLPPDFALKLSQQTEPQLSEPQLSEPQLSEPQLSEPSKLSQPFRKRALAEMSKSRSGQSSSQQMTADRSLPENPAAKKKPKKT